MNRIEVSKALVLNHIADDYEEPEQILRQTLEYDAMEVPLNADEIWEALAHLVGIGLAKAYWLTATSHPAVELAAMPSREETGWNGVGRVYFYITEEGKRFLKEVAGVWDEDGNVIWRDPLP